MTDPRWLTDTEMRAWVTFLETSLLLQRHIDLQLREEGDLTQVQYWILTRLQAAPDQRLRMTELAEHAVFSRSGLTYQIAQLEKSGLVRRETCSTDERGVLAVLTPEGERVLRRTAPGHVRVVRENLIDLLGTSQLEQLADLLSRAREQLRAGIAGTARPPGRTSRPRSPRGA